MAEETVEKSKHSIKINCVKLSKYTYIFIFLILIKVYLDSIHPTSHVCDSESLLSCILLPVCYWDQFSLLGSNIG